MRTRFGLLLCVVLLGVAAPTPMASAAPGDPLTVKVIHALGDLAGAADVYMADGAAPASWSLLAAGVTHGTMVDVPASTEGTHNVLVCRADPAPAAQIASCPQGSLNGNAGTAVDLVGGTTTALIAAYAGPAEQAPGRPTVIAVPLDVSCTSGSIQAKGQAIHAGATGPVDVFSGSLDTPPLVILFPDVPFGESRTSGALPGTLDVRIDLPDPEPPVLLPDVVFGANALTIGVFYGNPEQDVAYGAFALSLPVAPCPGPTTTVTGLPTTTAVVPVVQPAFTG